MGAAVLEGDAAAPTAPLYFSPTIYDFQVEGAARAYLRRGSSFAVWSTGLGKSHLAMMVAALMFEDAKVDLVLLCCESNKLSEWLGDFRTFTKLDAVLYRGSKDRRRNILAEDHQVLICTYETARNDIATRVPGKAKKLQDAFLTAWMRGKRVLVVYDEATKLRSRDSGIYRHHEYLLRELRKAAGEDNVKVLALTGTPFEKSPETAFNIGRLVSPNFCTVKKFEEDHVAGYDYFGNVIGYKNIGDEDHTEPWVTTLHDKLAPCLLIKDKSDPDVRNQFPKQVEEFSYVELPPKLRDFYNEVLSISDEEDPALGVAMSLRLILLHPMALTFSEGKVARRIVEATSVQGLEDLPVPKRDLLLEDLDRVVRGEGRKAVVFTFFGQSVLRCLRYDLEHAEYNVALNHGGMSRDERERALDRFRNGDAQILLSSDAGSKGINLPEATVVINYELPLLASTYVQRIDRVHRIDSMADMVWARSYIAKDTIEEALAAKTLERNAWFDSFISRELAAGAKAYRVDAAERRLLMKLSRDAVVMEEA